jgi:hypothetical protein
VAYLKQMHVHNVSTKFVAVANIYQTSTPAMVDQNVSGAEHDALQHSDDAWSWFDPLFSPETGLFDSSETSGESDQLESNERMQLISTESIFDDNWTSVKCTMADNAPLNAFSTEWPQDLPFANISSSHADQDGLSDSILLLSRTIDNACVYNTGDQGAGSPGMAIITAKHLQQQTSEQHRAWQYYVEVMLPALCPFLPLERAKGQCAKIFDACRISTSCSQQIITQTELFRSSELNRFGLSSSADTDFVRQSSSHSALASYSGFDLSCVLHALTLQVGVAYVKWRSHLLTI